MATKKTAKNISQEPAAPEPTPPAAPATGAQVLGPGLMKRPKREVEAAADASVPANYAPSEQVFRRR